LIERQSDGCENAWQIGLNGMRGGSDDSVAARFQHALAFLIMLALRIVDCSIHFNDQAMLGTKEIDDKWTDHLLATGFCSFELPVP